MLTLLLPLLGINGFITYGLNYFFQAPINQVNSLNIMTNSFIIGTSSYLFLNDYISQAVLGYSFQYTTAFLLNDMVFKYLYNIRNDFYLKLIHHSFALYAISRLANTPHLIALGFMTELTNLPLEGRFVLLNMKYNPFYIQEMLIGLLYVSFAYLRIYYMPHYLYLNYKTMKGILTVPDWIGIVIFYGLWCYWFFLINNKIYHKIKTGVKHNIALGIGKFLSLCTRQNRFTD